MGILSEGLVESGNGPESHSGLQSSVESWALPDQLTEEERPAASILDFESSHAGSTAQYNPAEVWNCLVTRQESS
jgi:hypothetical protein